MSISVSNNPSALLALQNLNRTTDQLTQVQDRISTQLQVADAKDNPTVWATAQGQRSQIDGLGAVTASLNRATSISDVALAAGQKVLDLLAQLKQQSLSAQDPQLTPQERASINTDFGGVLKQITTAISGPEFDGANLLDGSKAPAMRFLASADGAQTVTLPASDLSLGGAVIPFGATATINSVGSASAMMTQVDLAIANVTSAMTGLGDQAKLISAHGQLIDNLSNLLQSGVTDLVGSDNAADSARLKALQVQQQLGQQSLSIANSMPSLLLQLLR